MTADLLSHLTFFLPSLRGGGAEKIILSIAKEAALHLDRVDLVLVKHEGVYAQEDPGAVNIIDLNKSRSLASVPALCRYLRREKPQAMISATPHANIAAILAANLSRSSTRIIISEHSMMSRHQNPELKIAMLLRTMRILYRRADRAIATTDHVRTAVIQGTGFSPTRAHVVHNFVDLGRICSLRGQSPTHPWLSNKTSPVIVTAGRLVDEKDQRTLILALAAMSNTQARLIIFGDGPLRERLVKLRDELHLRHRVDLPGFVTNPYAEFAAADVFALPSKSEGFANVVIEALASNTPVVAMRATGGIADSLEDGRAVRLVDIGDDKAMAAEIDNCLTDPPTAAAMQTIAECFSLEQGWEGYRNVVLNCLREMDG